MKMSLKTRLGGFLAVGMCMACHAQDSCDFLVKNPTLKESVYLIQVYPDPAKPLAGCPGSGKGSASPAVISSTGFVLKNDPEHILTTLHGVVCAIGEAKADIVATNENGRTASGLRVSAIDVANDIALLDIAHTDLAATDPKITRGLILDNNQKSAVSNVCVSSIGNPRNLHFQPSPGGRLLSTEAKQLCTLTMQVKGLGNRRDDRHSPGWNAPVYVMELSLSPGDSGSPVFNREGKVIGMADGSLSPAVERVQWAIPLNLQDEIPQESLSCDGPARPYRGKPTPLPQPSGSSTATALEHLKASVPPSVLVAFMDLNRSCDMEEKTFTPECVLGHLRQFNGKARGDKPIKTVLGTHYYQEHLWLDVPEEMREQIAGVEYNLPDVGLTRAQRLNPFASKPSLMNEKSSITGHVNFAIIDCKPSVEDEMKIRLKNGAVHLYAFNLCNVQQAEWVGP